MTKVEELRDKIYTKAAAHIGILESEFSCSPDENRTYEELTRELATDLYALISASHAEGVAEGEAESESYRRTHVGLEWDALPVTVLEEGDYVMNRQGYRGFVESVKPIESMNDTFVWVLDEHNPNHHCAYEGKSLKKIPSVLAPKEKPCV
jgi:hypothetical protein